MVGAARMGEPLVNDLEWASVAPNGRTALVMTQGAVHRLTIGDELAETVVAGVVERPALAQWRADSSAVALYLPESRTVQWVRDGLEVEAGVALPAADGRIAAMAVDRNGSVAVAIEGTGVELLRDGEWSSVSEASDLAALILSPDGQTLWLASRSPAAVVEVTLAADSFVSKILAQDSERLAGLSAMALSSDGKTLYLADAPTSRLYALTRETGELSEGLLLDTLASEITPAGRASLFLLGLRTEPGTPVYLLDERDGPRVLFVPAPEGFQQ